MTTAVMNQPAGENAPARVLLVTINCVSKQKPLSADNKLNQALYGQTVRRMDLEANPGFCKPTENPSNDLLIELSAFTDDRVSRLRRLAGSSSGLRKVLQDALMRQFVVAADQLGLASPYGQVKIVLFNDELIQNGNVLVQVLPVLFPNARYFAAPAGNEPPYEILVRLLNDTVMGLPSMPIYEAVDTRLTTDPICERCKTPMRPAGNAFVCEGCDSTRLADESNTIDEAKPPACSVCHSQTQRELGYVFRCTNPACKTACDEQGIPL